MTSLLMTSLPMTSLPMTPRPMLRVATDVGGTFTDLVTVGRDAEGRQVVRTAKVDTTPPDFERGVLDVLERSGVALADIAFFAHGTTVVINALTERKGVQTGLITTLGFRDALEIARGNRPDFFNLASVKSKPFVPRRLRREVPGRLAYTGEEREPLDLSGLPAILEDFRAAGVRAVAICLLHAYADPRHEIAVAAEVRRLWPEVSVVASHEIIREWREYERCNTTVLSAYVQPIAEAYLGRLSAATTAAGFTGQLYVMQSNCGVEALDAVRRIPITMVESGPASGVWAAAALGRLIGVPNLIALDIGGTTAKCSLIENGEVRIKTDYWIERDRRSAGYPIMVPVVDLVEIGNGGGSIAWVDAFGKLHVGPRSAGAVPGPAAYGRGGTDATTTDANLALGRIDPHYFVGGAVVADMAAVHRALAGLGSMLGLDAVGVARGILRIADNSMVNALKLVSVARGHDPRDFTLLAFGGGGGLHAVALATELGCRRVIVPRGAAVFSAWGMMMSDLRRDVFVTRLVPDDAEAPARLSASIAETVEAAVARFAREGLGRECLTLTAFVKCRYRNQDHAVEVPVEPGPQDAAALADLKARFHRLYEREYSYRLDAPVEIVGLHLVVTAEVGKIEPSPLPVSGAPLERALKSRRDVDYAEAGIHQAAVYEAERLEPGMTFLGPAVIEDPGTTILVHPGNRVSIDLFGNVHIAIRSYRVLG